MSRPKPRVAVRYTTVVRCGDQCPWFNTIWDEQNCQWRKQCRHERFTDPQYKLIELGVRTRFPKFCPLAKART